MEFIFEMFPGELMRRFIQIFIVGAGLSLNLFAQARTLEEIQASGKIVLATEGAFPPFNYFHGSKLVGFEVELAEAMVKKMDLALEWKVLSFNKLLAGLDQNRWDAVVASFGITEERAKAVAFANPHYCSGGMIASKGKSIGSADMLAGKTVAVQTGSTYFENVKKISGLKAVKNFPQDTDARSALMNGRADAWVSDRFAVKAAVDANPHAGVRTGGYLFIEKIAIAIKKDNTQLGLAINKALAAVMADGSYKSISEKYLKEDVRCR